MKNRERIQARYLQDPLPVRLMGLAATLARVASAARRLTGAEAVAALLEESQYMIEWTAAETPVEVAEELVDLQALLAFWRRAWGEMQQSPTQSRLLAAHAKQWSDQVMRCAGRV
jgi:hypothetical protein